MGQRHQNSDQMAGDDCTWLNTLIDTFERTEELGNVPCDAKTVSAAMSRLESRSSGRISAHQRRRQATLESHH